MVKKIIATITLVSLLGINLIGLTQPPIAQAASVGQSIAQAGGCVAGGALSGFLSGLIDSGLKSLQDAIKKIANQFVKGLLSGLVSGLFGNVPTDSKDQATQAFLQNYYYRDTVIARCLAREMLDNIGQNTANIIKTRGRDGGPTNIQNWTNFITQAQYRGENIARAELSTAKLCNYLSNDFKQAYGVDPKKQTPISGQNTRSDSLTPYSLQVGCTLPNNFNLQNYQTNFAGNGGWDAFTRLLEPQNNPLGLAELTSNEIENQRLLQEQADQDQAIAGRGYTGISGNGASDSCLVKSPTGQCLVYKDIKTTGSYLADAEAADIGAQYSWITSAQGLNTVIEDLTQNMINRLFDQSDPSGNTVITPGPTPVPTPTPSPTETPGLTCADEPFAMACMSLDQSGEVAKVKNYLVSKGIDLTGDCGAFEITKRVAWALKDATTVPGIPVAKVGLISKGGTSCNGFSADKIAYPDKSVVDILGDSGGANNPQWLPEVINPAVKWTAPTDPGDPPGSY